MSSKVASIDALLASAIGHVNAGERARARALCAHALVAFAPHPAVHQLLALLDLQQGDVEQSRQHSAASLTLRPDHLPTLAIAADAARAAGDESALRQTLERIVALAPERVDAWFQLALQRHDARDLPGAARALHEVLRLDPGRADAQVNLGIVLQESGRLDEAMQAYGRAYRLHDDSFGRIAHALATPNVGRLWLNLDDLRSALRASAD